MASLTLRLVKGTPLTNAELDANFTNLNNELAQKLVASDLSGLLTSQSAANTYLPLAGGIVTGATTFKIGNAIAAKIGVSGLFSIGGEAGSADSLLTVTNGGAIGLEFSPTAIAGRNRILSYNRAATAFVPLNYAASEHNWDISGTVHLRLNSSGNLGLGVTPSAWASGSRALQIGGTGSAINHTISSGNGTNGLDIATNAYYNAGWKYIYSSVFSSARYALDGGTHAWFIAPSGTAGNAITFTQVMTLDASGNLGVGLTNPASFGKAAFQASSGATALYAGTGAQGLFVSADTSSRYVTYAASGSFGGGHIWQNGNTEVARLDLSGNLLVGTTSKPGGFGIEDVTAFATGGGYSSGFTVITNASTVNGALYIARRSAASATYVNFATQGTSTGSITTDGTTTTYNTTSDYRLKTVICPVADAGQRIDALHPIEYKWNADGSRTRGFLAHQFQEVYAGSVTGTKDAVDSDGKPVYQQMQASTSEVIADLVAEIQSLRARVAALESN